MLKVAKYTEIMRINVLQQLAYRGEVFARAMTMVWFMIAFAGLWTTAYTVSGRTEVAGFRLIDMLWYLVLTETLSMARARSARVQIDQAVKSGDVAYTLNKPFYYPLFQFTNSLGQQLPHALLNLVLGSAVVLVLFREVVGSLPGLLAFFTLGLLAIALDASLSIFIGLLAFYTEETQPLDWLYTKLWFTVGGTFLPLDLFPEWLRTLSVALPFQYLAYTPARAFIDFDPAYVARAAVGVVAWIAVAQLATFLLYRRASRRLVVNGG